jgi:probable rRNA maturation factor
MAITFHVEHPEFKLSNKAILKKWIQFILEQHGEKAGGIAIIFTTDDALLEINKKYLDHDYYTDIITFEHSEKEGKTEGDIFISVDRVKENALKEKEDFNQELCRVIIHGVLHLLGYLDKTKKDKAAMTDAENTSLGILRLITT